MAAPTSAAKREKRSCQTGAVRTWRMASTAARIDVAIGFAPVHRLEAIGRGREGTADVVVAQRDGRNRGELRGVTVNELVKTVHENESIYIPIGAVHRLENPG